MNSRTAIEQKRLTLDYPALADRVVDKLYSSRMPIEQALAELSIGDCAELKRWRGRCAKMFDLALGEKQ